MEVKTGTPFIVDMAPTWEGLLPLFLETLDNPAKADLHAQTREELRRMAKLADAYAGSLKNDRA